ncbi:hypothetical protein OG206_04165 [Streptomyces sp. NBC_01341]|uniref:hypothetical protein n=1 Tax=Streptomyces sp. NBC_01341 TaxID=2903831 RepID=UPI002E13070E|nr:hypothetical protein OG206_04165 [Streptomyces sp. NBC_01341]
MDDSTFPHELVQAQRDWNAAYAELARPRVRRSTTEVRRTLLRLSAWIRWHPYWTTSGAGPAARVRLREAARTRTGRQDVRSA